MKRTIPLKRSNLTININGQTNAKEIVVIENSFKECIEILNLSLDSMKNMSQKSIDVFEKLFGNRKKKTTTLIHRSFDEIKILAKSSPCFVRKQCFLCEDNQKKYDVLASANLKSKYISIYDSFFDDKFSDNRGGVILHELAHLYGLKSEAETNAIDSAECLKNFALIIAEKITLDELFKSINDENITDKKNSESLQKKEELTYSPDQPRAPKGQSNGGQWISEEGGISKEEKEVKSQDKKENHSTENKNTLKEDQNLSHIYPNEKISKFQGTKADNVTITPNLKNVPKSEYNNYLGYGDAWNNQNNHKSDINGIGAWVSGDIKIKKFAPNTRYSIKFDVEYSYCGMLESEQKQKKVSIVYDTFSDKNGDLVIERLGLLNVNTAFDDIDIINKKINIKITSTAFQGKASDLFKVSRKDNWCDNNPKHEIDDYLISHAINNNSTPKYRPIDNGGGKIEAQYQKKEGILLFKDEIIVLPRE